MVSNAQRHACLLLILCKSSRTHPRVDPNSFGCYSTLFTLHYAFLHADCAAVISLGQREAWVASLKSRSRFSQDSRAPYRTRPTPSAKALTEEVLH